MRCLSWRKLKDKQSPDWSRYAKNSIKNTRINGEVLKELSRIISREIKDPRICPMTSVVSVEVTPQF